jgi:hypothetical protein
MACRRSWARYQNHRRPPVRTLARNDDPRRVSAAAPEIGRQPFAKITVTNVGPQGSVKRAALGPVEDTGVLVCNRRHLLHIEAHHRARIEIRLVHANSYHRMSVKVALVAAVAATLSLAQVDLFNRIDPGKSRH